MVGLEQVNFRQVTGVELHSTVVTAKKGNWFVGLQGEGDGGAVVRKMGELSGELQYSGADVRLGLLNW